MNEIRETVAIIMVLLLLMWIGVGICLIDIERQLKRIADAVERDGKG